MNEKYIINLATSALISYFDNGYEYTQVIEGGGHLYHSPIP